MSILHSSNPAFELPPNIYELLGDSLVAADELNARHTNTRKYFVEDQPDLFVRLNPCESVEHALRVGDHLTRHGIDVLPYHVVQFKGEEWVITQKVTGENLETALSAASDSDKVLIDEADLSWAGLVNNLIEAKIQNRSVPYDVESPSQYMLGTINFAARSIPRVWLVDLPQSAWNPASNSTYAELVLLIANGIVGVETAAIQKIKLARAALRAAIKLINKQEFWPGQLALACEYVLESGIPLDESDDHTFIHDLSVN